MAQAVAAVEHQILDGSIFGSCNEPKVTRKSVETVFFELRKTADRIIERIS